MSEPKKTKNNTKITTTVTIPGISIFKYQKIERVKPKIKKFNFKEFEEITPNLKRKSSYKRPKLME